MNDKIEIYPIIHFNKKMDSLIKHATLDLYYTLLDSNDIYESEKETLFRKHNNLFIQIGKCLIHFHFYSISLYQEPVLKIMLVDPIHFLPIFTHHPSFAQLKMIFNTTLYDYQKIILEIQKLRTIMLF